MSDNERDALIRKAYSKATTELRDLHRDQFNALMGKHAEELGVDWKPKQTEEEKALQQYRDLLAKYPNFTNLDVSEVS